MSNERAKTLLDEATMAVQTGQFANALPLIDQSLALDPSNYESYIVRGIALSQTNQPEEAIAAFRAAIDLQPSAAKAHYNLAVHLYGIGRKQQALDEAKQAMELDPTHLGARELVSRTEQELGFASSTAAPPQQEPLYGAPNAYQAPPEGGNTYYRPGYDSDPELVHSIPMVERMGKAWLPIGIGIGVVPVIVFLVMLAAGFSQGWNGAQVGRGQNIDFGNLPMSIYIDLGLRILCAFGCMTWLIMDVLDRRKSLVWLIPQVVCCCGSCGYLPVIVILVYIAAGRK